MNVKRLAAAALSVTMLFGLSACGEPISGTVIGKRYQPFVDNEDPHYEYSYCMQTNPNTGASEYKYGWCYDSGVPDTQECYEFRVETDPNAKGKRKRVKTCVDKNTYETTEIGGYYTEGER